MIKKVLFDVDGVLLSEERYFDASALTVWEVLHSKHYLGLGPEKVKTTYSNEEIRDIRQIVFQQDTVLKFLKSRGLNANWDMIYITLSYQLIHLFSQIIDEEKENVTRWLASDITQHTLLDIQEVLKAYDLELSFDSFLDAFRESTAVKQELMTFLNTLATDTLGVPSATFGKKSALWSVCEHTSQEWYVGDDNILASTGRPSVQTGKKGFLSDEETLSSPESISQLFQSLLDAGVQIGVGTGRPELETIEPFRHLEWLGYFDRNRIVTADDVLQAEKVLKDVPPLAKPNPFSYLLSLSGRDGSIEAAAKPTLPIERAEEVLVVGDSLADLLAARQMGCQFAAILTGLSGKDARPEFEEYKADYILDSVLDIKEVILGTNKQA